MKFKMIRYALFFFILVFGSPKGYCDVPLLFSPPSPAPMVSMPAAHPLYVARQKVVVVDIAALGGGKAEEIKLRLFEDALRTLDRTDLQVTHDRGFAWYGRMVDVSGSQVLLVADQDTLSGVMRIPPNEYKIRPMGDGLHLLRQIAIEPTPLVKGADEGWRSAGEDFYSEEQEVLRLVNTERAEQGLHALAWNDLLAEAARRHSLDMATQNYFSHTGKDGREFNVRITDLGYRYAYCGENIAYGYGSPAAVMEGWMNSAGHRKNIMGKNFCDIGIGVADHANTGNRLYWTQDFGRQQGVDACPAPGPTPGGNPSPVAIITVRPLSGAAPLQVELDASQSYDPDGKIVRYLWDFGDGSSGSGEIVQHQYTDPGTYSVSLTVADDGGAMTTRTKEDMISVSGSGGDDPGNNPGGPTPGDAADATPGADDTGDGGSGGCFITLAAFRP